MQKLSAGSFIFEPPFTSLDHLVGDGDRRRHFEAESLNSLVIEAPHRFSTPITHRLAHRNSPSGGLPFQSTPSMVPRDSCSCSSQTPAQLRTSRIADGVPRNRSPANPKRA